MTWDGPAMTDKDSLSQVRTVAGRIWLSFAVLMAFFLFFSGGGVFAGSVDSWWSHRSALATDDAKRVVDAVPLSPEERRAEIEAIEAEQERRRAMTPERRQEFNAEIEKRREAKRTQLTNTEPESPHRARQESLDAYTSGEMPAERRAQMRELVKSGDLIVPEGFSLREPGEMSKDIMGGLALMFFGPLVVFGIYRWGRWLFAPR